MSRESLRDALEEPRRVDAVVVGERDQRPPRRARDPRCARARGRLRAQRARARGRARERPRRRARRRSGRRRSRARARSPAPRASRGSARAPRFDPPSRRRGRTTEAPATRAVGYGTSVPTAPLVTVLLAVHDGERTSEPRSRASSARPSRISSSSSSTTRRPTPRPRSSRASATRGCAWSATTQQLGLAGSLNRGLDDARGTYVARLDADDVAMPRRLERQLARIRAAPPARSRRIGRPRARRAVASGRCTRCRSVRPSVRWAALFSSPFFHPTVLVERDVLERHALRYDTSFEESEDYELWSRLLDVADGDNRSGSARPLPRPPRAGVAAAARAPARVPAAGRAARDRRGRAGSVLRRRRSSRGASASASRSQPDEVDAAVDAYLGLVDAFEQRAGRDARPRAPAPRAARTQSHRAGPAHGSPAGAPARPGLPAHVLVGDARAARRLGTPRGRGLAASARGDDPPAPVRVAAVFPEPTPYRAPLLDRVAAHEEIDLTVVYAADTVAGRTWRVEPSTTPSSSVVSASRARSGSSTTTTR